MRLFVDSCSMLAPGAMDLLHDKPFDNPALTPLRLQRSAMTLPVSAVIHT